MINKLLAIKEIAKILMISDQSVNRYVEPGLLKTSIISQWRIKESNLEKFLKEN